MLKSIATCTVLLAASALHGQTVHVRFLDGKTAKPISGLYLEIADDDHKVPMQLKPEGLVIDVSKVDSLQINGAGVKPHSKVNYYVCSDHMFVPRVDKIVANGVDSGNNCSDLKESAKPGEIVIFLHKLNWMDKATRAVAPPAS